MNSILENGYTSIVVDWQMFIILTVS